MGESTSQGSCRPWLCGSGVRVYCGCRGQRHTPSLMRALVLWEWGTCVLWLPWVTAHPKAHAGPGSVGVGYVCTVVAIGNSPPGVLCWPGFCSKDDHLWICKFG